LKHVRIKDGEHATFGNENNPFGWLPPAQTPAAFNLADLIRRCRWIASDIGASGFALFFHDKSPNGVQLAPCFDSSYPGMAAATKAISACVPAGEIGRHLQGRTEPCWWSNDAFSETAAALGKLAWVSKVAAMTPEHGGIAFPVHAERNRSGLIVFLGAEIAMSQDALFDVHARCFSLFSGLCRIRSRVDGQTISRRELECLKLTANGYTSEDIARLLKLSVHTANQYLAQSAQKLNAVNRTQAVAKALRLGLIE
jgi:DNA-binding CsgD family transcriptional regulator